MPFIMPSMSAPPSALMGVGTAEDVNEALCSRRLNALIS